MRVHSSFKSLIFYNITISSRNDYLHRKREGTMLFVCGGCKGGIINTTTWLSRIAIKISKIQNNNEIKFEFEKKNY